MKTIQKIPLRLKLALLSTAVTAAAVLLFTYMSLHSANVLFVSKAENVAAMTKITLTIPEDAPAGLTAQLKGNLDIDSNVVSRKATENTTLAEKPLSSELKGEEVLAEAVPLRVITAANGQFRSVNFIFMGILIIIGAAAAYFITGKTLSPVGNLSTKMKDIDENSLFTRIESANMSPEIKSMTDSFNHMLERLEIAFQTQKSFAAAAAHELKTPLCCISTNIDILQLEETPTIEEYQNTLEIIKRNTDRLMALSEELLDMNRSFKDNTDISLSCLMEDILRELYVLTDEKNISVHINGNAVLNCSLNAAYRIFYNLIENSIKYTPENGSVSIDITSENGCTAVSVTDTGIGILQEEIPFIFDPFYRVDKSRNRKAGGAGLGLSIVKDLVEKSGGKITVTSKPGEGSCFQVSYPAVTK